jgi:hypothetical protein
MYELSRVRLFSVGPPGARYQDVCLDLRGIGPAVRQAPAQMDFFAADDVERVPRRPSPASVLFLENGGGKSVLLKLVFSVILPGRRQVVGTTSTNVLEKFVLGDDVAHVACEWMHSGTGALLVTGKVSEWRGHTASADPDKLADAWYSFTPGAGFGLDDLPFTRDRRRLTLPAFRDRLAEADQADPTRSLVWETGHADWSRHLVDVGLDPELFRYQRAMNAGEGEAADAFTFPTDEAFVDFLLRAVLDPEEPRTLAELVAGYAKRIAERADLELEREFVAGVLDLLGPLAEVERAARLARAAEDTARRSAHGLAAAVVARRTQEQDRLAAVGETVGRAADDARLATGEERRLGEVAAELRRLVAALRLRAATATRVELAAEKGAAEQLVDAWRAVDPVLGDRIAAAEARRLRAVVGAEQERARPALLARQSAAAALAASLDAGASAAEAAARAAADAVRAASITATAAREEELRQVRAAAGHRAAAEQADAALGRIRDRVAAAVVAGLLRADEDVAEAAERAAADVTAAAAELAGLHAELDRLRRDRRAADARLGAARTADAAAAAAATAAEDAWGRADERRRALVGEQRLADLLGLETVEPETDAGGALDLVTAAVAAGERERTGLLAAQDRDARALRALGEGGLLPPLPDVEQALDVLEAAGVRAWSGWRYLAMLPADAREQALHRFPHLVGGVLLNDPTDADRAREALDGARGLPSAVVAVGSTAALDDAARDPAAAAPGVAFVVPPNPALVDEDAAAGVRAQLGAETADRAERLAELEGQLGVDRGLADRLRDWATRYPPGALDALEGTRSRTTADAVAARAAVDTAAAEVAAVDDRAEQVERSRPRLDETVAAARERAVRLDALRAVVAEQAELRERLRSAGAAVTEADDRAAAARAVAERARGEATEAQRTEDRQTAAARSRRDERAALPLDDAPAPGAVADEQPLEVLRTEYRRAAAAYSAAEINPDLRAELVSAERAAESAREIVDRLEAGVRDRADALLRTPDGADEAARHAAAEQARRALAGLTTRLQSALTEETIAGNALAELPAQLRSLEPYGEPTDVEHGRELLDRVGHDLRAAEAAAAQAVARQDAAQAEHRAAQAAVEGFANLVRTLDEPGPGIDADTEGVAAFVGDATAASQRWAETQAAVREAAQARGRADAETRRAADGVAKLAQDPRFDSVTSPVRRHILKIDRSETPAMAAEWELALRPRLRSLDDDLANIGRHRSGIVTRLQGMVGEALRTLRLAGRLSQLPDGLSDWSGQQFLRIRFDDVDDVELTTRLGDVVDRTAVEHTGKGGTARERRDGLGLLLRGVRAAMPKGERVEMLKPDAVLRTERLRVSEIRDVFSGGQQLTAAIVLYCTMAALRANQRGQGRRQHAGVLFLDNPIGRASAGYLLELQFGVAQALGVQLIYTTGLFDAGALSAFPLIVRLRNDADLRAGRKYLSVDEHIRRELDGLAAEDGTGRIAASRVYRRPEPAAP